MLKEETQDRKSCRQRKEEEEDEGMWEGRGGELDERERCGLISLPRLL